jgi:hypothetical protein
MNLNLRELMTVDVPAGDVRGLRVERFTVDSTSPGHLREVLRGRGTRPGTYTRLLAGHRLWMTDTDAERQDHMPAARRIAQTGTRRVLINGLGLGMVLRVALAMDHVEHVDVVEIDDRVIELVGAHYTDPRLTLHHADAYDQARRWPAGSRWDVVWHDIWPDLCTDNLDGMARLHRSYGRRAGWQGSWGKTLLEGKARADRKQDREWARARAWVASR